MSLDFPYLKSQVFTLGGGMGRLAATLRRRIEESKSIESRAIHLTELGFYLARVGEIPAAMNIASEIRENIGIAAAPRLAPRVLLLEGLVRYYSGSGESPRERVDRAFALARGLGDASLLAIVAAWKAHLHFIAAEYQEMRACMDLAMQPTSGSLEDAFARCSLTLIGAFTDLGWEQEAKWHFEFCRSIANRIGDEAAIGAIIYNRYVHRISKLRYERRTDPWARSDTSFVPLELSSGEAYDAITRNHALPSVSAVWRARLMMLRGVTEAAAEALEEAQRSMAPGIRESAALSIDWAWCGLLQGKAELALDALLGMDDDSVSALDADDRAIYYSLLLAVARLVAEQSLPIDEYRRSLEIAEQLHDDQIRQLALAVTGLERLSFDLASGWDIT